ncbi:MAG: DUF1156 domain-containing protein [Oscillospiraceae bacterium]|nr:DUF1156 domain-containing protein [Oscillospiraceae bacterium]
MEMKKKLIEVALPLEAINAESAREKSIRHGHPSTLHLWWARRPLATARAVIWSSLVDDPSSHPELFPDEESQRIERERLFAILTKLVVWENSNDAGLLADAKREILKSTENNPPALLDPFSGGGAIPLEAQRLGLKAYANDLNPVAVMINKAMIEIPPRFAGQKSVNPHWRNQVAADAEVKGAAGLAEDVRYYGNWMKNRAFEKIGHLYPKVQLPDGKGEATVIAWIWARTVRCPNPACGCEMPLNSSYVISNKKGHCAWVEPIRVDDHFEFRLHNGPTLPKLPVPKKGRGACFVCPACGETTLDDYVKQYGKEQGFGYEMTAIVAEGSNGRIYLTPDHQQITTANVDKPLGYPDGALPTNPRWFSPPAFGMEEYYQLFTNRQLTALTTFSSLVTDAIQQAERDAVSAGLIDDGISLSYGGKGARAYGEAIGVYLGFFIDRMADRLSTLCSWDKGYQKINHTFARQALPMVWDFTEGNPFSSSTGSVDGMIKLVTECLNDIPTDIEGVARQFNAQEDYGLTNIMVSTDPPYYDNIGYADLSDYFYVWLRHSIKNVCPDVFRTMLVPKAEELVATPYRFNGSTAEAKEFFESGMSKTCQLINRYTRQDIPVTIYYAFKQSESDVSGGQTASTGWETMLSAIIKAGFVITGTWPFRTELSNRTIAMGTNALASSIVLVCRKRAENARSVTRREFINALHREMRPALEKLQSANIAPVDLAQSAIGPGIGVFSRFKSVLEADGKPMSVRSALQIINQELDAFYNEQEGELDRESRFCVDLFNQYAFNNLKFGDADVLARAKNTSVQALADRGVMYAAKGQVRLLTRDELPETVKTGEECIWLLTQQLARAMEKDGVKGCARIVMDMYGSNAENAKALAYRLYTICERKNWAQEGFAYNNLVVAWPEIQAMAADMQAAKPVQMSLSDLIPNNQ